MSSNFAFSTVTTVESFLIHLTLQTLGLESSIGASPKESFPCSHLQEYLCDVCIFEMGMGERGVLTLIV